MIDWIILAIILIVVYIISYKLASNASSRYWDKKARDRFKNRFGDN